MSDASLGNLHRLGWRVLSGVYRPTRKIAALRLIAYWEVDFQLGAGFAEPTGHGASSTQHGLI